MSKFEETLDSEIGELQRDVQMMTNSRIKIQGVFKPNILEAHLADQEALLEWVLQSSGGGDWRRRVEVKLAAIKKERKG